MATEQYRTTVSAVFWTADTDAAQAQVDAIKATLPDDDQASTAASIEFVADGRPEPASEPEP